MLNDLVKNLLGDDFSKKAQKLAFLDIEASEMNLHRFALLKEEAIETNYAVATTRQPILGSHGGYRRVLPGMDIE